MFRTGWSIIRRIKCLITQAASGTVPSVVDVSCVAVGSNTKNVKKKIIIIIKVYQVGKEIKNLDTYFACRSNSY